MPKDKLNHVGRPKKPEPTDRLPLPRSLVKRIRRLAAHDGEDPGEWAAQRLSPIVSREEAKMLADIEKERRENGE